jgi:hypothetical protein
MLNLKVTNRINYQRKATKSVSEIERPSLKLIKMKHKKKNNTMRVHLTPHLKEEQAKSVPNGCSSGNKSVVTEQSELAKLLSELLQFLSSKLPQSFVPVEAKPNFTNILKFCRISWRDGREIER